MNILDWNKLRDKDKKKLSEVKSIAFIAGPVCVSKRRIKQIVADLAGARLLFGCLKDEGIPDLEGSLHFQPLELKELTKALDKKLNVSILCHFHKDIKHIIKELKPSKVLFVNGSWKGQIHYRSEYWKAVDVGAKIELISPFMSDREAKNYERRAKSGERGAKQLYKKRERYSDEQLIELAWEIRKFSWDWIGQIGAVLARKGKVLAVAWNRVLPYEAYQMHVGSPREAKQIPSQEMLETQLTNHAECEILEIARRNNINLNGTSIYINLFPCPICAKNLSRTEIERIVYSQDHNLGNDIGYKILEMSGKKIKRIVV